MILFLKRLLRHHVKVSNYNGAYSDIKEVYMSDSDPIFKDLDVFFDFDAPSLRKVCKRLEKEGYNFSFDVDDIKMI